MKLTKSYEAFIKSNYFSAKHTTYFDVYDEIFEKFYGKNITFVEIGVLGGGSLFMWRELFGPKARIIGIDLNPSAKKWEDFGFEIFIGDQSSISFWDQFYSQVGQIDVLLDDGGHTYEQQIITVDQSISFFNDGGLIVIEDTHTSYLKNFGSRSQSFIKYVFHRVDEINLRFNAFNKYVNDIYRISFFESFVIFKIDKKAKSKSAEINNNGKIEYKLEDFRDKKDRFLTKRKPFLINKIERIFFRLKRHKKLLKYFE